MTTYHSLTPAYGKKFTNKKEVLAVWINGQDFVINPHDGQPTYINRHDANKKDVFNVRYSNLRKIAVISWSDKRGMWIVK